MTDDDVESREGVQADLRTLKYMLRQGQEADPVVARLLPGRADARLVCVVPAERGLPSRATKRGCPQAPPGASSLGCSMALAPAHGWSGQLAAA